MNGSGQRWAVGGRMNGQSPHRLFVQVLLAGFLLISACSVTGCRRATGRTAAGKEERGTTATPAPDFEIPLFGSDAHFRLSEHRGQGVVLNFWASWCGPCRKEMPILEKGWQAYKDHGVVFVGVNISDSEERATAFLHQVGVTYPNGPDPGGNVSALYHLIGLPETFFIKPDGTIAQRVIGGVTEKQLKGAVKAILPK